MLPTPSLGHLSKHDYLKVYEPAEDTFIFLDALEQDADELRRREPRLIVEIGSGSGCVSAFIAQILGDGAAAVLCTDINSFASECTRKTGAANKTHLEPVVTHMLSALSSRAQGAERAAGLIDVLLFNPPYVPTTEEEEAIAQREGALAGSWAGGSMGTNLLNDLITSVDRRERGGIETVLSPGGVFYFVAIKQNDPDALVKQLRDRGLDADIALSRRAGREHLFIIRARKSV